MSQKVLLHRDCSYSQYRNKKSANKIDLSKSIHQSDNSINNITVSKTSQVQSLQKQLHSLIRKRSTSSNSNTKKSPEMKAFNKSSKNLKIQTIKNQHKGKQNISIQQIELSSKKLKNKHSFLLNQTFQPILQNCTQNQQDDAYQKKEEKQKILTIKNKKTDIKKKTTIIPQTKMAQSIVTVKKSTVNLKATIDQLDDMQKKLENVKNIKKSQIKLKQSSTRQPLINKLHRVASENKILTQKQKNLGESLRFKVNQHLPLSSVSINIDNINTQRLPRQKPQSSKSILPTKMIKQKQKQKLLHDLQSIKDTVKNSQISSQNIESIRLAMRDIMLLLNN